MSKKSDDKFIKELFGEYRLMIYKIALSILHKKSDAEDVVQNVFLWIINNLSKIKQIPCNKIGGYFAITTKHICYNMLNKERRHPLEGLDDNEETAFGISVEKSAIEHWLIEEVKQIISAMPENDRIVLQLSLLEDRSGREVAEITGFSEANVRSILHRAKKRLIELLKERGIDYE